MNDFCKCGLPRHPSLPAGNMPTDAHICRERLGRPLPLPKERKRNYNGFSPYAKDHGLWIRSEKKN